MLRCTKTSPGASPITWFAGTRLSEQPIHRYSGDCCLTRREKNSGSSECMRSDQFLLLAKRCSIDWDMVCAGLECGNA